MITSLKPGLLVESVMSVPPLCRDANYVVDAVENAKLVKHIEAGGVKSLLYGGNANFYHIQPTEYGQTLRMLEEIAGDDTLVIPSVGPTFGLMMDQARIVKTHRFPTVMILPQVGITTSIGVAEGVKRFAGAAGIPALLYIKNDGYIEVEEAAMLAKTGVISGIKYATVRTDPAKDEYLRKLVEHVDRKMIISGIGEQPAIVHLNDFGLGGFTSGCVCVAPKLSATMLKALRAGNTAEAERIRQIFRSLEDLRNGINPIRVLHEAVRLAGIANTGPLLPLLSNLEEADHGRVGAAAKTLLAADR